MAEEGFELRSDPLRRLCFFKARGGLLGEAQKGNSRQTKYGRPSAFPVKTVRVIKKPV